MCLIIVPEDPKGLLVVTEAQMEDAYRNNNDGWGFMWAERGRVKQVRGFSLPVLNDTYEHLKDKPGLCLHFRMGTSGGRNLDNCHPFRISKDLAIMHNGVFRMGDSVKPKEGKSDTAMYADALREYTTKYGVDVIHDAGFLDGEEKWMGTGNRVVYLDSEGRRAIANYDTGIVKNGMWYSNTYAADFLDDRPGWKGMRWFGGTGWRNPKLDVCEYCKGAVGKHECLDCFGEYCDGCYDHGTQMCIKCLMEEAEKEEDLYGEIAGVVQTGKEVQRSEGVVLPVKGGMDLSAEYSGRSPAQFEHAFECRCVRCIK